MAATLKLQLRLLVQERLETRAAGRVPRGSQRLVEAAGVPGLGDGHGGRTVGGGCRRGVHSEPLSVSEPGALPSMNFRIAGHEVSV